MAAREDGSALDRPKHGRGGLTGRPNILIIKADQHNARCLGVNGHPQVKTPNLDRLAREGVNFTQAFVQNPICTPSRMCYLTGQYVHNHGVYGLSGNETFLESLPSMFSVFRREGYRTGIVGHIHVKEGWLRPHCDQYRDMYIGKRDPYSAYLESKGLLHLRDDVAYDGHLQTFDACPFRLTFEDSCEGYVLHSFREFLNALPAQSAPPADYYEAHDRDVDGDTEAAVAWRREYLLRHFPGDLEVLEQTLRSPHAELGIAGYRQPRGASKPETLDDLVLRPMGVVGLWGRWVRWDKRVWPSLAISPDHRLIARAGVLRTGQVFELRRWWNTEDGPKAVNTFDARVDVYELSSRRRLWGISVPRQSTGSTDISVDPQECWFSDIRWSRDGRYLSFTWHQPPYGYDSVSVIDASTWREVLRVPNASNAFVVPDARGGDRKVLESAGKRNAVLPLTHHSPLGAGRKDSSQMVAQITVGSERLEQLAAEEARKLWEALRNARGREAALDHGHGRHCADSESTSLPRLEGSCGAVSNYHVCAVRRALPDSRRAAGL